MGEYEPRDSRNVTLRQEGAPGEPPRTGPREHETRQGQQTELEDDGRGDDAEQTVTVEQQQALQGEESMQVDTDELDAAAADRARLDGND